MEHREAEEWVEALIAALRPGLIAHAVMWEDLSVLAPPPEELAETLVALLTAPKGDSPD